MADSDKSSEDNQWRIDNALGLKNARLQFLIWKKPSENWDHDHCSACWAKFAEFEGPDIEHEGYATSEDHIKGAGYYWVCKQCFTDLKEEMGWTVCSMQSSLTSPE